MEKLFYDLYDFAIRLAPDDDYMENFPDLKERFERIKNEQFLGKTSLEMVVSFLGKLEKNPPYFNVEMNFLPLLCVTSRHLA